MRLVYREHHDPARVGTEVKVGDVVRPWSQKGPCTGKEVTVSFFRPPHKPASGGHVTVKRKNDTFGTEVYVSIIGAEWIEREDR